MTSFGTAALTIGNFLRTSQTTCSNETGPGSLPGLSTFRRHPPYCSRNPATPSARLTPSSPKTESGCSETERLEHRPAYWRPRRRRHRRPRPHKCRTANTGAHALRFRGFGHVRDTATRLPREQMNASIIPLSNKKNVVIWRDARVGTRPVIRRARPQRSGHGQAALTRNVPPG